MARISSLLINGAKRPVDADAQSSLLSVLREQLDLTGTKYGCGEGQCGACTVLIDGVPRRSCLTPVADAEGKAITTIEGLAHSDHLHPVQESGRSQRRMDDMPKDIGAWLHIGEDGNVIVFTGKVEVGQNIRTSLSQAVAEELRVPTSQIKLVMGDTLLTPYDMGTFGSR